MTRPRSFSLTLLLHQRFSGWEGAKNGGRKESETAKWSARGRDARHGAWAHPEDDVVVAELLLIALPLTR